MASPAPPESYFDFIKTWLEKQPEETRAAKRRGGLKAVRVISEQLAHQTRNRIRATKSDWQPLRWRIRHKVTDAAETLKPRVHAEGLHAFVAKAYPCHRLTLAHTLGDRLRLQATLRFLNDRVDHQLSPRCYGNRPNGSRNCTDRRTAVRRFQRLVWPEGNAWVAKLDVKKFYDTLPHGRVLVALESLVRDRGCVREIAGYMAWYWEQCWPGHASPPPNPVGLPQGSPISAVLANIYMTSFDKVLTDAGIEHIRFLDDVTIVAASPEQLAADLEFAMQRIEGLGLMLACNKTRVAHLSQDRAGGSPSPNTIVLPMRGDRLQVHGEFDELGVHFYADGRFRARHRTVNRLLSKARREIRRDRGSRSPIWRYLRATASVNLLLGYQVALSRPRSKALEEPVVPPQTWLKSAVQFRRQRQMRARPGPPRILKAPTTPIGILTFTGKPISGRCWISGVKYVQPRQHALLGHSDLILSQMHRVDTAIRRWMKLEFGHLLYTETQPQMKKVLRGRRIRSAAKMYEMAAREPMPRCPGAAKTP